MTPERWQQVKQILETAEEQPTAHRRKWVETACEGDTHLLAEVRSFLAHEDRLEGFIEEPVLAAVSRALDDLDDLPAGTRIGPYRLVQLLGRGGMGVVYLAQREEDFAQRVALKLLHAGPARGSATRRFQAERQILARLEHPNIARLLDGGTTDDGIPYFAMEVVEGLPIDLYCNQQGLDTRERLRLFLDVCSALQRAHQSLVIHRDLKPGNILVDASGVPKLLDFGIAKLLDPTETGSEATKTLHPAMTLRYASPEQLLGEPVGTTSDVYSLAVVMYLVLTGRPPYNPDGGNQFLLLRAICEEEPPIPSEVADKNLRRQLAGDVDAILLKALRKEPARRYGSIQELADDVRRHLDGLPVVARQGNFVYRAGKFIRRHRAGLVSLAAMLLLALGFTIALVRQLHQTERARDRAERISEFLIELFQVEAPDRPAGKEPTVRELLENGRQKLEEGLDQDPETRATLLVSLGQVYQKLGEYAKAETLLKEAIRLQRRLYRNAHTDLAGAINDLATVYLERGEYARAEMLLRECITMRQQLGSKEDLIKPMNNLAAILMKRGELDEAEKIYRESLARRRATLVGPHPNVATSLHSLALVLNAQGKPEAAEPLLREALDIHTQVFGPESAPVGMVLGSLALVSFKQKRLDQAEALYTQGLEICRAELGEEHLQTAVIKKGLGAVLIEQGRVETARPLLEQALTSLRKIRPPDDPQLLEAERLLAELSEDPGPTTPE